MLSLIRRVSDLRTLVADWRASKRRIGFVPTMGALHQGHRSLMKASLDQADKTIVSIFVNPLQFDRKVDLDSYPRSENEDRRIVEETGVHALFLPSRDEMYPAGFATTLKQTGLVEHLCGASRPGHFEGVLTVVAKLFNVVMPDVAFFGQKDFQQTAVIRRMVADLNLPVEVKVMPTVREPDGLALSSRNVLLSKEQRLAAPQIYAIMRRIDQRFRAGSTASAELESDLQKQLAAIPGAKLDYAQIVDPSSLEARAGVARSGDLLAVALYFDNVRLIDNLLLGIA